MLKILKGIPEKDYSGIISNLQNMTADEIVEHFRQKSYRNNDGLSVHNHIEFLCLVMLAKNGCPPDTNSNNPL